MSQAVFTMSNQIHFLAHGFVTKIQLNVTQHQLI